jgi:hypothetical protein
MIAFGEMGSRPTANGCTSGLRDSCLRRFPEKMGKRLMMMFLLPSLDWTTSQALSKEDFIRRDQSVCLEAGLIKSCIDTLPL